MEEAVQEAATEEAVPQSTSMFDFADAQGEQPVAESGQEITEANDSVKEWFWREGVKGEGEPPEWLDTNKYLSVENQAMAYQEARKKIGKMSGAPEEYDLSGLENVDPEAPIFKNLAEIFKGVNLSQEGFNQVVNQFVETQLKSQAETLEREIKSMGPEGKEMVNRVSNWAQSQLSPEELDTVKGWMQSSKDIVLLDKLRAGQPVSSAPVPGQGNMNMHAETVDEVQMEINQNWKRYSEDPSYAQHMSKRRQAALIRSGVSNDPNKSNR